MDLTVGTFAGSIVEPTDVPTEDILPPTEDILPPILPPTEDILPASDNIPVRFTVGIVISFVPFTHLARQGRMIVTIGRRELLAALSGAAARGSRAAAGEDPAHRHNRRLAPLERLPSRVARSRLPRRPEHRLRLCVWRRSAGATRRGRGGARSSPGGRYCNLRHARKLRGQASHHHGSHRHDLDRRSRTRRARAKPRPTGRKYHRQHDPWSGRRCQAAADSQGGHSNRLARSLSL